MSPRAGLTAERITQAAAELADEVGFDSITVAALARKFGVKDASMYSHIKNLEDLRNRVAMLAGDEKTERIATAVAGRAGRDALVAFADEWRRYALEHPGRYAATQMPMDPAVAADWSGGWRAIDLTYGMLRAYGLGEPDVTDAVRLLRSTFHGFANLEANGGFGHSRCTAVSWDRIVDALHITLTHWPTDEKATSQ
ncbi:TetR/AcrR family transcriptional regulator [Nocardia sp. NPDC051990]|uniref:TetR/AcrR family transcriptional regulator n=1 Tax=Nocardia sp. NPDC051990 TaxID=3155285 RepID=UPI0034357972